MTAGPLMNLTTIEKAATVFPQEINLGCNAMNKPEVRVNGKKSVPKTINFTISIGQVLGILRMLARMNVIPRLNIAIPKPASERIDIDLAIIKGI